VIDHRYAQTAVRHQGQRDTCVGFAVSAAHEWMASETVELSPEDAIWAAHQHGGSPQREATLISLALAGLSTYRHALEHAWPYGSPPWPGSRPLAATALSEQRDLPGWRELHPVTFATVDAELRAELAVLLSIRVVRAAWKHRADGLVDAPAQRVARGGHAVLVVGVIDDSPGERLAIVKNSWSTKWGVDGYGFITERYFDAYLKRAFVLERGVTSGP
jgi:hypothetical protein